MRENVIINESKQKFNAIIQATIISLLFILWIIQTISLLHTVEYCEPKFLATGWVFKKDWKALLPNRHAHTNEPERKYVIKINNNNLGDPSKRTRTKQPQHNGPGHNGPGHNGPRLIGPGHNSPSISHKKGPRQTVYIFYPPSPPPTQKKAKEEKLWSGLWKWTINYSINRLNFKSVQINFIDYNLI